MPVLMLGKADRGNPVGVGNLKATAIAGSKLHRFAVGPTPPDRSDRMDHVSSRQAIASGQLRIACWTVAKHTTFLCQFRPRCAMDCSAHPTAGTQRLICRIYNMASTLSAVMSAQMAC